ncbi:hypothetical protein LJB94_01025 [Odoribacter sp. OttesenSCG-928-G04]|nr:hypothetical protein [Odoribacter sp. OttesenSCG-928-G04]
MMEKKIKDNFSELSPIAEDNLGHLLEEIPDADTQDVLADEFLQQYFDEMNPILSEPWGNHIGESLRDFLNCSKEITNVFLIYENFTDDFIDRLSTYMYELDVEVLKTIKEALVIINWYIDIIYSKLMRALFNFYLKDSPKSKKDYNGSAKVTLIGIDKSIEAWSTLLNINPDITKDVSHLIVILQQLKRDIDRQFKEAKTFIRPGFDE